MNVTQLRPRTLSHVLLDVRAAQSAFNDSWDGPLESACLDRLEALQDEARAMIEAATGVSWAVIAGSCL